MEIGVSWISASLEREREREGVKNRSTKEEVGKDGTRLASRLKTRVRKRAKGDNKLSFFDEREGEAEREKKIISSSAGNRRKCGGRVVVPQTRK